MADVMRKFMKHMDGINAARQYDAAAKAMAEHCDERIAKAKAVLSEIINECETGPQPGMRQVIAKKAKRALDNL